MSQQLTLSLSDIEAENSSISTSDIEPKMQALQRFLGSPARNTECSVNQYESSKCDRRYFRLSWRVGTKMKHIHIPGGSTLSELAQYRAGKLQEMIDRGAELAELIAAIQMYRGKKV